jgi:hypothetical protein
MDIVMPNGKKLADCNGEYVRNGFSAAASFI